MKTQLCLKIDANATMEYFCYSYCRTLVDTAKEILEKNAIFKISPEEYQETLSQRNGLIGVLDNFTSTVLTCIVQQIPMGIAVGSTATRKEVEEILGIAEKFLKIFEDGE